MTGQLRPVDGDRSARVLSLLESSPHVAESPVYGRFVELLTEFPRPFDHEAFTPGHITASAFITTADRRELLLILHGTLGLWLQPGGHVDVGDETLLAAAVREAREETGITDLRPIVDGAFDLDVHDIPATSKRPAHQHFDVTFLFEASHRTITITDEIRDARWVALADVPNLSYDAPVLRAAAWLRDGFG